MKAIFRIGAVGLFAGLGACSADGKLKANRPGPASDATTSPERGADAAPAPTDAAAAPDSGLQLPDAATACLGNDTGPPPGSCAAIGVAIDPAFLPDYTCFDLGPVPGLPAQKYGGLTLTREPCSTRLYIGGAANTAAGKLYSIDVRRDSNGHVTGFSGTATVVSEAPFNDGGITFGPTGVLFFARWPTNELQQTRPGSMAADKVIALSPFGFGFASASLAFVPAGFPGAGQFKMVSWPLGQWYTATLAPDGQGTFDLKKLTTVDRRSPGGPEGFVYVAPGSPKFDAPSVLVSEWDAKRVSSYTIDERAEPLLATRRDFVVGLNGAEGAYRDPATGDFFFSTFTAAGANVDRVIVVRGFRPTID